MAVSSYTSALADKPYKCITRFCSARIRAWVARATAVVQFTCRNSGQSDPRPFRTPHRPIAVPDMRWGAAECFPCRNDRDRRKHKQKHGFNLTEDVICAISPARCAHSARAPKQKEPSHRQIDEPMGKVTKGATRSQPLQEPLGSQGGSSKARIPGSPRRFAFYA